MGNQWADNDRPRVGVVIQRFVEGSGGGAEEHCLRLVHALRDTWELDVLTTCARSHHTWANELPQGPHDAGGYRVIRFPVTRRKRRVLAALLPRTLLRVSHSRRLESLWVRALGPDSPALLGFVEREAPRYSFLIFYTYLYATTVLGLPRAGPRTLLIPTAHDEPAIHFGTHREAIARAGALCFLTPEEELLVRRVAAPLPAPGLILGAELDPRAWLPGEAEAFRAKYDIPGPFVLYLGRIERSKGLGELFSLWKQAGGIQPTLVLAGRQGPLRVPRGARVLGYLPEEDKRGALAACQALVQPSERESLSIVVLEAWAQRAPVITNRRCAVLEGQRRRSGGGLGYRSPAELSEALQAVSDPETRSALGESGHQYALATAARGNFKARLMPFLESLGWVPPLRVGEAARA